MQHCRCGTTKNNKSKYFQKRKILPFEDFDVDHFVSDCRKRVQLEALRDDLELYHKLLKTAMVELINKDYAGFVSLSTNLVGMDKALSQLSVPLGQLREEVLSLRSSISEGIGAVGERMSKQEDIRGKKVHVCCSLCRLFYQLTKLKKILGSQHCKEISALEASSPLLTEILERIATEFNQLQCHAVQSKALPVLDKIRPGTRIPGITAMLQQSLEGLLLEGLQTSSVDIIPPCLRTYATIDQTWDAEALVGQVLVKPYIDEVILEQIVDSHLSDLQFTYDKLLEFVPHHCHLLREVTGGAISSEKGSTVSGYDFLVNSLWPEIVRGLEEKLPLLFNPGNPDGFHQKYTISMDFVRTFERQCGSKASVKRLRAHSAYHSFSNKWNLPIYFQIRFREIAGSLEAALTDVLEDAPAGSLYCLLASHRTWSSLQRCRSDKMFLPLLAHRLWRLMLQILAQYSKFVKELLLRPISNESAKDIKKPLVTGSKDLSITQGNCEDQASGPSETKPIVSISSTQLVSVVTDLDRLQEQHPFPSLWRCLRPRLACCPPRVAAYVLTPGERRFRCASSLINLATVSILACKALYSSYSALKSSFSVVEEGSVEAVQSSLTPLLKSGLESFSLAISSSLEKPTHEDPTQPKINKIVFLKNAYL
ncbi:hypothetical protein FD754_023129, partial [Muntiacus muntjak]